MQIDFYEEFPIKENIEKLNLVKFRTRVFVAGKSLNEFYTIEKQIKKIRNKKIRLAYWPIIKNSYWISPFSETKDLVELFNELDKTKIELLIDLEPPLKRSMIFKNLFKIGKNKKIIQRFMEKNKGRITTAQIPSSILSGLARVFGLEYKIDCEKSLMFYSSMISRPVRKHIISHLRKIKDKNNYVIGLGTIDLGILGDEPILSPENLEKDLELVKKLGFEKVVIFRLSGLNQEYLRVIEKYV